MPGVDGRSEIIIAGSNSVDGPWKEYEFIYKPGNVNGSLWTVIAPYQPRLDWQMWFAAQGDSNEHSWTKALAYRLLTGQPEVLALMNQASNPFKNAPPKFIRAYVYKYHFSKGYLKDKSRRKIRFCIFTTYCLNFLSISDLDQLYGHDRYIQSTSWSRMKAFTVWTTNVSCR